MKDIFAKGTGRKSSIELLRLACMFGVVLHHFYVHSGFQFESVTFNKVALQGLSFLGKEGVDCFVLITGYFSCRSTFKTKHLVELWMRTFTYALLGFVLALLLHNKEIGGTTFLQTIFPVSMGAYWFVTTYFILLVISPFLNILLNHLTEEEHKKLIAILFFLISVVPIVWIWENKRLASEPLECISLFILLYCMGAWIRRVQAKRKYSVKRLFILSAVWYASSVLFEVICNLANRISPLLTERATFSGMTNSPALVISSFFAVYACIQASDKSVMAINKLSAVVLDVYLISDNVLNRKWIWQDLLKVNSYESSRWLILLAFAFTALVFSVCLIIGLVMQKIFFVPLFHRVNPCLSKVYDRIDNYFQCE